MPRRSGIELQQEQLEQWEAMLRTALTHYWNRRRAVVLAKLTGAKVRKGTRHWSPPGEAKINPLGLGQRDGWRHDLIEQVGDVIRTVVLGAIGVVLGDDPLDKPTVATVDRIVATQTEELLRGQDRFLERLGLSVERLEESGADMDTLTEEVDSLFDDEVETWVPIQAGQAAYSSANEASLEAARSSGVAVTKIWLSSRDNRVRPTHKKADGQEVPVAQPFSVGGALLMFPQDPTGPDQEVKNCRCTMLFTTALNAAESKTLPEALAEQRALETSLSMELKQWAQAEAPWVDDDAYWSAPASPPLELKSVILSRSLDAQARFIDSVTVVDRLVEQSDLLTAATEAKALVERRVRTAAGARRYGVPIGSIITVDVETGKVVPSRTPGRVYASPTARRAWDGYVKEAMRRQAEGLPKPPRPRRVEWREGRYDPPPLLVEMSTEEWKQLTMEVKGVSENRLVQGPSGKRHFVKRAPDTRSTARNEAVAELISADVREALGMRSYRVSRPSKAEGKNSDPIVAEHIEDSPDWEGWKVHSAGTEKESAIAEMAGQLDDFSTVADLAVLDFLSNEGDRHENNWLLMQRDGRLAVAGVDQSFSFTNRRHPLDESTWAAYWDDDMSHGLQLFARAAAKKVGREKVKAEIQRLADRTKELNVELIFDRQWDQVPPKAQEKYAKLREAQKAAFTARAAYLRENVDDIVDWLMG